MPRNKDTDDDNYSFYSTFIGYIVGHEETWLVGNGASRHMTGSHDNIYELVEKKTSQRVELGDNKKYEVKGSSSSSFRLESRGIVSIKNILYVPILKKNFSISYLEDKGYKISFVDGHVQV